MSERGLEERSLRHMLRMLTNHAFKEAMFVDNGIATAHVAARLEIDCFQFRIETIAVKTAVVHFVMVYCL